LPAKRFGRKVVILLGAAVLAAGLLPAVAWNAPAARLFVNPIPEQDIDPARQASWILDHPGSFWHRVKQDLRRNGLEYWEELVGRLGWVNIRLPSWIAIGYGAACAACLFLGPRDPPHPAWWQRMALVVAILGGVLAIELSQYLSFNPVRSDFIFGVQGRYFVPFAFVAAFAFSNALLNQRQFKLFAMVACSALVVSAHFCTYFALARAAGRV
jgi:hypothetical protein